MVTEAEMEFMFYRAGTAGSFRTALYNAFAQADHINQAKLESVFPDLSVLRRYQSEDGYWQDLQKRWGEHLAENTPG